MVNYQNKFEFTTNYKLQFVKNNIYLTDEIKSNIPNRFIKINERQIAKTARAHQS